MTNIVKLEGNAHELWADEKVKANLKLFINKRDVKLKNNGEISYGPSKYGCISKLFHNSKMKKESSYFEKKVNAAIQEYNDQVKKITKKGTSTVVNTDAVKAQINAEQKKIHEADAELAKLKKAQVELFAPLKDADAEKTTLLAALKEADISMETIKTINAQNEEVDALDESDKILDKEMATLNTQNGTLKGKYWAWDGIWVYNQGGDLNASLEKIKKSGKTDDEIAELSKDVAQVIKNDVRLKEIPVEKTKNTNRKKDIQKIQTPLTQEIATKITANKTKDGMTSLSDFASINDKFALIEKKVADKKAELAQSPEYKAIEAQIQAANAAKKQANDHIAKLNQQLKTSNV